VVQIKRLEERTWRQWGKLHSTSRVFEPSFETWAGLRKRNGEQESHGWERRPETLRSCCSLGQN